MPKNKCGFTIIELLTVVIIIAALTAIALPQYQRSVARAEAMEAMVSLRTLYESAAVSVPYAANHPPSCADWMSLFLMLLPI